MGNNNSYKKLINIWKAAIKGNNILPDDRKKLTRDKLFQCKTLKGILKKDFFIEKSNFHEGLLPYPYVGNLEKAKIYLLMLNPGVHLGDYRAEQRAEYKQAWERNIRQTFGKNDYPFFFLNPKFADTPAFDYWHNKLKDVIKTIIENKRCSYEEALRFISKHIACLELVAYRSPNFNLSERIIKELKSVQKIRSFANSLKNKTLIVLRSAKLWNINGDNNIIVYENGQAQAASLTANSEGGERIIKILSSCKAKKLRTPKK